MLKSTARLARRAAIIGVLLGLSLLWDSVAVSSSGAERQPYSAFLKAVDAGQVTQVVIDGEEITWKDGSGSQYETTRPNDPDLVRTLMQRNVMITVMPERNENPILYALINWLPMILLIGVWIFFMRRYRAAGAGRQAAAENIQDLAAKLDATNAHLARIEALLAGSPPKTRPDARP